MTPIKASAKDVLEKPTCRPCGKIGNLSREHVLAQWLQPFVRIERVKLRQGFHLNSFANREFDLKSFVTRCVCSKCNNEWMSDLENRVKPILPDLIQAAKPTWVLTDTERFAMSLWAFKTAFMILSTQTSVDVPCRVFSAWVLNGVDTPSPAVISGMTLGPPHSLHRSFGYILNETDISGDPLSLRVAMIMQALVLVVEIPLVVPPKAIGIEDPRITLLSSQTFPMVAMPKVLRPAANSFDEFLHNVSDKVQCGW